MHKFSVFFVFLNIILIIIEENFKLIKYSNFNALFVRKENFQIKLYDIKN